MQMQEVEIFGERKGPAFLTESIKTLNGKSCSPEVITTTIGSFICGSLSWKLFLCSRAGEKGGRGRVGVRFMGRVVHPSQILAFHLTSASGDKSPQPLLQTLTFQPGCFIAGPTVVCARSSQITVNCLHFHSLMGSLRRKVVNGRSVNTLDDDNVNQ